MYLLMSAIKLAQKFNCTVTPNLGLALIYFLLAKGGLYLATLNHAASPVWPATGFAIAIIYIFGNKSWYAVALGAFAANVMSESSIITSLAIASGNTLEALIGAYIIRRVISQRKVFTYQTEAVSIIGGSVMGSMASALIGVTALYTFSNLPVDMIVPVFSTWWVGDTIGGLVVASLILHFRKIKLKVSDIPNFAILIFGGGWLFYFVFFNTDGGRFLFLLFPILLFAVRSLQSAWVLGVSFIICTASIVATVNGYGPFSVGSLNERLIHLQLFLGSIAITSLVLFGFGKDKLSKIPTYVLLISWFIAGAIFYSFADSEKRADQQKFNTIVEKAEQDLIKTMKSYELALKGGTGLYAASDEVSSDEWHSYCDNLDIEENFPGIRGLGVIWVVPKGKIKSFESDMKKSYKNFYVRAAPERSFNDEEENHYVIKYLEPHNDNIFALGLDINTELNRKRAAELSRDTGMAAMSSKVVLIQDKENNPGFLFFLPIYKHNKNLETVEDRRNSHLGWIYAPFVNKELFGKIFKNEDSIELKAAESDAGSTIIFDNYSKDKKFISYKKSNEIVLGQQKIKLEWKSGPNFKISNNTIISWVGFAGAMASLFLTQLLVNLLSIGLRSRELAEELTKELSTSREKFKEGERRLLYALDGSNDGIWDWNIEKLEMYVSGNMCETYGWPQKSKVKSVADLSSYAHPDDLDKINSSMKAVYMGKKEVHEVETRYKTKAGEWRWVLTRGKISERNSQGLPIRMTGVHIDIDDSKKAGFALQEAKLQLANVANSIPTLISLWDKNMRCQFANDAYAKWLGQEAPQLLGRTMKEIVGETAFEARKDLIMRALAGERIAYDIRSVRRSDGESRYLSVMFMPYVLNKKINGFYVFVQDVTDSKQQELTAIDERKKALEATTIKSQFLANMSHEIRTPINGIIGMTSLLLGTELDEQQREYTEIVNRSSEILLNLVNDILDFSKIEAGKLRLEHIDLNINQILSDTEKSFAFQAKEKSINLEFIKDNEINHYVKGDPGRIQQIFNNLISNAVKFTEKGNVTVKMKLMGQNEERTKIRFEVTDSGIGMSQETIGKMFQAFSQADSSTSRKFGGTGLGLSICKQLVTLMNGEIGVTSEEKQGSTFWFTLNLESGALIKSFDKNAETNSKTSSSKTKGHILVAEDNKINQRVAELNLKKLGYTLDLVENGAEALELLKKKQFDLVLLDCQMPLMDGYECVKKIRSSEDPKVFNLPVIALTANVLDGDKEKCFEAGMDDFLTKPFKIETLSALIEKWINPSAAKKVS